MKPKGRHPIRALTALRVRTLSKPGRYADGDGLYLVVDKRGSKRWMLRTMVRGRRSDLGLGSTQTVTLAEAREMALKLLRIAKAGGDPLSAKRRLQEVPNFADAALHVHRERSRSWRNRKHVAQWIGTLQTYAVPHIGTLSVDRITSSDILSLLEPIWISKPETARRLLQRIATVMDWANAAGHRTGDNPTKSVVRGLPIQTTQKQHHAALPFTELPEFMLALRASNNSEPAKLAFEFLILTATRTNEVLRSSWKEFREDVWTIPAERTKQRRDHRVPLTPRCLEILRCTKQFADGSDYVFPGRTRGKPLSSMVFLMALRRMDLGREVTGHGFRSSFTDWAHERTNYPHIVIEKALGHAIQSKTEASYRRGDLFQKRRELMMTWEQFMMSQLAESPANKFR